VANNLEDLIEASFEGAGDIIEGDDSFDFNPPESVSAHAAATGFDSDFTETVVIEEKKQAAPAPSK